MHVNTASYSIELTVHYQRSEYSVTVEGPSSDIISVKLLVVMLADVKSGKIATKWTRAAIVIAFIHAM